MILVSDLAVQLLLQELIMRLSLILLHPHPKLSKNHLKRWPREKGKALFRRDVEEIKRLAKSKSNRLSDDPVSPILRRA